MVKIKHIDPKGIVNFPLYIGQPALLEVFGKKLSTSPVVSVPVCTPTYTEIETKNSIYRIGVK